MEWKNTYSLNSQDYLHIVAADVSLYPGMDRNVIKIFITTVPKQFSQWSYNCINILIQIVMLCLDNAITQYRENLYSPKKWYCYWRK